uniref:Uncharacterized protein n=1 Tax=Anopheles melas TaxID=34690 RepID=A0A182TZ70_9DIPT
MVSKPAHQVEKAGHGGQWRGASLIRRSCDPLLPVAPFAEGCNQRDQQRQQQQQQQQWPATVECCRRPQTVRHGAPGTWAGLGERARKWTTTATTTDTGRFAAGQITCVRQSQYRCKKRQTTPRATSIGGDQRPTKRVVEQ